MKKTIGYKVNGLLSVMVLSAMLLSGSISMYSLCSMKNISVKSSRELGQTAAEDAENALESMAVENLQTIAVERAAYIEEKFEEVESYVLGIAGQAQDIYEYPEKYPDRTVFLPVQGSTNLAAQLLWSEKLEETGTARTQMPDTTEELNKLGNIQDLLVQYNANNDMVSSTYLATESGWMIQADYIAFSKYEDETIFPIPYEAAERQWYKWAKESASGQIIYTDVIKDVHEGGDCIVCASPVYYKGEVVAVAGVGSYLETVNDAVLNTAIGEAGYAFLVNESGQIMVSGRSEGETAACAEQEVDLRNSSNAALAEAAERMVAGYTDSLKLTLDDREVYLAYAPLEKTGWSFVTVIDVEEVIAPAKESQNRILNLTEKVATNQNDTIKEMFLSLVAAMAAVMLSICLVGNLFSRKLTAPIHKLTEEVAKINGGNLDCRIHIATGDEVEDLSNAFNKMTAQIQSYVKNLASVTAEKERIRTEIQVASRLQADMLPKAEGIFKDGKEFTLAASMTPAKGVGGDFYDFFLLDEDRLALVMADVSGKGVPAALFMVVSRTLIKGSLMAACKEREMEENSLAQVVEEINRSLCANNQNGMFVTAWIGILRLSTGELTFVNAGHCRPLIRQKDGTCVYDTSLGGFVLAGMEDMSYKQNKIRLRQGDTLLLYTDGVTEATSSRNELYGEPQLKAVVEGCDTEVTPEELLRALRSDIDIFQKGVEQFDDITMLAVKYQGDGFMKKTGKPDVKYIWEFSDFVEDFLKEKEVSVKTIVKTQMAVDEIYSNICYYSGATEITVGVRVEEEGEKIMTLCFEDNGVPYNPLEKPEPDVKEPLEKRKVGGLGIYLVKKQMDRVEYEYAGGKNRLTLVKIDEVEEI